MQPARGMLNINKENNSAFTLFMIQLKLRREINSCESKLI